MKHTIKILQLYFHRQITATAFTSFHILYHNSKLNWISSSLNGLNRKRFRESHISYEQREKEREKFWSIAFACISSLLLLHPSLASHSHTHTLTLSLSLHTTSSIIDACFRQMLQGLGLRQQLSLWRKKGARWWNRYFFTIILLTKRITVFFLLLPVFLLCCGCTVERVACVWQHSCVCVYVCAQKRACALKKEGAPFSNSFSGCLISSCFAFYLSFHTFHRLFLSRFSPVHLQAPFQVGLGG